MKIRRRVTRVDLAEEKHLNWKRKRNNLEKRKANLIY